jgi:hypothetical protein
MKLIKYSFFADSPCFTWWCKSIHFYCIEKFRVKSVYTYSSKAALSNTAPAGALAPAIYFSGALRKHIIWADY